MIVSPRLSLTGKKRTGFPLTGKRTTSEHPYPASDLLLQWRMVHARGIVNKDHAGHQKHPARLPPSQPQSSHGGLFLVRRVLPIRSGRNQLVKPCPPPPQKHINGGCWGSRQEKPLPRVQEECPMLCGGRRWAPRRHWDPYFFSSSFWPCGSSGQSLSHGHAGPIPATPPLHESMTAQWRGRGSSQPSLSGQQLVG